MMRRAYAATTIVLLTAGLLAGCGAGAKDSDSKDAVAKPTVLSTPTAASKEDQADIQAKVVAGAPPADLIWKMPAAPATWRGLKVPQGMIQWQVGTEPCTVVLNQPSGVGKGKEPTSEQVVQREIGRVASSLGAGGTPKVVDDEPVMMPNQIIGLDGTSTTKFARTRVDFGQGKEAEIRALRSGDFALIAVFACGKGRFDDVYAADVEPFYAKLAARTTY